MDTVDEDSISQSIDAFLRAVDTNDLAMLEALPFLDLLDDDAEVGEEGQEDNDAGPGHGITVLPYTDSDDEEMDFKYKRCKGDCHSHVEDFYTTCKSKVVTRDTMMSAGSSLRSDNPLLMDTDEEEEADHYENCLRASREMFAEWRDLEDHELDEYLGNVPSVKKQKLKVITEAASDNSDVDIEGISDNSTDYSSDVDIENVHPGGMLGDAKRHTPGNKILGNSLDFHNYAMNPQSVFRFTGKPASVLTFTDQPFTCKFTQLTTSLEKPTTSAQKMAFTSSSRITSSKSENVMPSTSAHKPTSVHVASKSAQKSFTSLSMPSTSAFTTASTSTQISPPPAKRGRPRTTIGTARRGRPPVAPRRGRPSVAPRRGRPSVASNPGRRRSAMLVAAAIRRPTPSAEPVRNLSDSASSIEHNSEENVSKQDRLNMLERSRRLKLSNLLEGLRLNVPSTAQLSKASKSQTLNSAIEYIGELQAQERSQNMQISAEMERQEVLLRILNSLKAQK